MTPDTHHGSRTTECPQCGTVIIGATPEDWQEHFAQDCETLGALYTFAISTESQQ